MTREQIIALKNLKNELHWMNHNNDPETSSIIAEEVSSRLEELINVLLDNEV